MSNQLVPMSEAQTYDLILKQAEMLAQSKIVPSAYRRQSPDIVAAGLAGRAYGWDVMTALRNFHVIEGTASLKPEAMLGLVRQVGHSVTIEVTDTHATATGKRADTGDTHVSTFTMKDAEAAGLAKKRNWAQYRSAMLTWRAVSQLCRVLFPDVVLGAGYVPEEIGASVDQSGDVIDAEIMETNNGETWMVEPSAVKASEEVEVETIDLATTNAISTIIELVTGMDSVEKDLLKEWWKLEGIPPLTSKRITTAQSELIFGEIESLGGITIARA